MVMTTPVMFKGVSWSPKNHAETLIVATSFAIPAIDIGTTPARCKILEDRSQRIHVNAKEHVLGCP